MAGQIRFDNGAAAVTPPTGETAIYTKADKRVYSKDDTGAESPLSAPSNTDSLPEGITNLYFTDERAQDAVGSTLTDTATIDLTYNDGAATISADIQALSVTNAHVALAAAIALSKLAATTANRALVSDASGVISPATTTSAEIGYVSGVTSGIQAQLDAKQVTDSDLTAIAGLSSTGLIARTGSGTAAVRTIQGSTTVGVTNGNGVAGDPTLSVNAGSLTNAEINASAAIAYTKLNLANSILNTDINAAAAIAYTKLNLTGGIVNADINAAAAIAYTKLSLANSIVNADISATAAITYAKLNLTGGIVNADINAAAAIVYSKLNLTGGVVNADVNAAAAIAYSKLALSNSIVNADINAAAAIAYSKLNLTGGILNTDVNAAAAIAYSKLNLTGGIVNADVNAAAAIVYSKLNLAGGILNADINAAAAIALTKLATTTVNRAIISDGTGILTPATTTATEIGYVNGVTSSIQTQIDGKQASDSDLTAVAGLTTTGLIVRTGTGSATTRSVAAGSSKVTVSNGDGVAGNPTVDVVESALTLDNLGGTLSITKGGTGQVTANTAFAALSPMTTRGDLITRNATVPVRLGVGAANTVLTSDGTDPSWNTIVNANVNATAAIARSKLASGTAYYNVVNSSAGVMTETAASLQPTKFVDLYEEFVGNTSNSEFTLGWVNVNAGAGSGVTAITTATNPTQHVGVVQHSTGTTATGRASNTITAGNVRLGGGAYTWESVVRVPTASTGTERFKIWAGIGDTTASGDMTDGVYFTYTDNESSGNWQANTASASTRTATSSATAVSTAWVRLRIELNAAATSATFYINGTSVATIATNIPTATTTGWIFKIEKSVGTTARTFEIDYFYSTIELTTLR